MIYKDYPEYTFTYLVIRGTGWGTTESPRVDVGPVFGTDDLAEANGVATKHSILAKMAKIESVYTVVVNTSTEYGKLLKDFFRRFEPLWKDSAGLEDHHTYEMGEVTIRTQKNPLLD